MPSNLLNTITSTSQIPDPLPLYTRRDPETVSIRSSAPSYVSEAPTYHSSRPENHRSITFTPGLQPAIYAPGFNRHRSTGSVGEISNHKFNISEWSSVSNGPQARHYQNVAHRRATIASAEDDVNSLAAAMSSPAFMGRPSMSPTGDITNPMETHYEKNIPEEEDSDSPITPLEDPDLVGHEAAARARERRIYMSRSHTDAEAMKQENKTWDFMLAQMADWKERERSWEQFRREVSRGGMLGRRIGLGRRRGTIGGV
ncbi:hypothetical protein MMC06_005995 [Schaereria dolodes]|nr:hypothetical protein [Schaereria dolodes]